jgi:non-specific serine/threonine protein kinase
MAAATLTLALTPHGHLVLLPAPDAPALPPELQRRLERSFERGAAHGLLELGLREVGTALPPVFAFWRDFAARYVATLCTSADTRATDAARHTIAVPAQDELDRLVAAAPPMSGGEYLTAEVLGSVWEQVDDACRAERTESKQSLQDYLKARNPAWHLVGRVHFNLAENRSDEVAPFAFIATYTTQPDTEFPAANADLGAAAGLDLAPPFVEGTMNVILSPSEAPRRKRRAPCVGGGRAALPVASPASRSTKTATGYPGVPDHDAHIHQVGRRVGVAVLDR